MFVKSIPRLVSKGDDFEITLFMKLLHVVEMDYIPYFGTEN